MSGLAITYPVLKESVGRYLGLNEDADKWRDAEESDVEAAIRVGLRQFLWPPELPSGDKEASPPPRPYEWSFLRQSGTLELTASQSEYSLPTDFNQFVGVLTGTNLRPVRQVDEGYLRAIMARSPDEGAPVYMAVVEAGFDGTVGSRRQVIFAPAPDAAYSISYRYSIVPSDIDDVNIYPLGGVEHGETILQSCLAAAEMKQHDQAGPHYQRFLERLSASIRLDMQGGRQR